MGNVRSGTGRVILYPEVRVGLRAERGRRDGRLVPLGRREVALPDDLADIATFPGVPDDTAVVLGPNMPIFMSKADADANDDRSLLEEDDEGATSPGDSPEEER